MIIINKKEECCGCNACKQICPKKCISMEYDKEGFLYPKVDESKCIKCNRCIKVCPMINNYVNQYKPKTIVAKAKNEDIRRNSSSGGVFSIISEKILDENGVIFGATLNSQFDVEHISIKNKDELKLIRGSKYIQSNINDNFINAKKYLTDGRQVLFSGTPCQIAGLKKYLGKDYDNLICIDIFCHGVPSKEVFSKYIEYLECQYESKVKNIEFRNKDKGWNNYSLKITFVNEQIYRKSNKEDPYLQGFIRGLYLRPACYNCKHKGFNSGSDISLGDMWGSKNLFPRWEDNKGISVIACNTLNGETLINNVSDKLETNSVTLEEIYKGNKAIYDCARYNSNRPKLFSELKATDNIVEIINRYMVVEKNNSKKTIILLKKIKNKIYLINRYIKGY